MSPTNFFTFSLIRVIFGEAQNHSDLDFSKVSMEFEIFFFLGGKESRAGAGIFLGGLFRWWLIKRYFENKKFLVILLFVILFLFS